MGQKPVIYKMETKDMHEAMALSGHNFEVDMIPLAVNGQEIWDKKAVIRKDTGAYLGVVGRDYQPVQPQVIYDMAQVLIDSTGGSITGGVSLQRGSVMGVSLTLGKAEFIPGDVFEFTMLLLTSFNMSYSVLAKVLTRRFFCMNQMPSSKHLFSLKHTTFVNERLGAAMKMLAHYNTELTGFQDRMVRLINAPMAENQAVSWFKSLFPTPKEDSKRGNTLLENNLGTYVRLLNDGKGSNWKGVRGTAYGALNALTEFCNHYRSTRIHDGRSHEEVKFESLTFGSSADLMDRGLQTLLRQVDTMTNAPIKVN